MSETSSAPAAPASSVLKGIVKSVLSADTIIIRGQPRNGPPPEKTISIAGIQAPKLARRPGGFAATSEDEPFAWECREFLRKKLIGQAVTFVLVYRTTTNDREYGELFLGSETSGENMGEALVAEGLVEVRPGARETDALIQRLRELEASAKAAKKARWGAEAEGTLSNHVRNVNWNPEVTRNFVDSFRGQPIKAVVEQVRDGATIRAFLLPDFHYVTLIMSGLRAPIIKLGEGGRVAEAEDFAEEAKYFTEVRLLQQEVEIVLESTSNQSFVGSVLHPQGSIAELLLRQGYARCVDWSISLSQDGPEKLRAAERVAKDKRLRIWKSYTPAAAKDRKSFHAKVVEVVNGDALMVRKEDGSVEKIWLASVRPPRREKEDSEGFGGASNPGRGFRPLYDVPFMFEAREFLRKRLIHKRVTVTLDYVQPGNETLPPRNCCTVTINGQNVAEALVAKGLATLVRYRQDDENRSAAYDALLAAESKAEKSAKGIHSLKGSNRPEKLPVVRVQDLQGDAAKARQFLPYLQRAGKCEGIVEFVASGSRLRVFIPKETCLVTILLTGISCPRAERTLASGHQPGEPWGNEAAAFSKERVLQREVEIEVESVDKAGSFIGWVKVLGEGGRVESHLAVELVKAGLASVHHTAEYSSYASMLYAAEEEAKKAGEKLWEGWSEVEKAAKAEAAAAEVSHRRLNYRHICITDLAPGNKMAIQFAEDGPKLEQMMSHLRQELKENPPVTGSYSPKRGDLCAAKFSADGLWYRARVEEVPRGGGGPIGLHYVDFGNREKAAVTALAPLPATFHSVPPGAKEFQLAFLQFPEDPDYAADGAAWLSQELSAAMRAPNGAKLMLNEEYRNGGTIFATIVLEEPLPPASSKAEAKTTAAEATAKTEEAGEEADEAEKASEAEETPAPKATHGPRRDIGKAMLEAGLAILQPRKDRRFASLMAEYAKAMDDAKKHRRAIWQYGDFTGTDI